MRSRLTRALATLSRPWSGARSRSLSPSFLWPGARQRDFAELAAVLRVPGASVQLTICGRHLPDRTELVLAPIQIPALSTREARARPDHRRVRARARDRARDLEPVHGGGSGLVRTLRREARRRPAPEVPAGPKRGRMDPGRDRMRAGADGLGVWCRTGLRGMRRARAVVSGQQR
jgi:hypothetical protein